MEEDIDDAATASAADAVPERPEPEQPAEREQPAAPEQPQATGEPRVDDALRRLGELGDLPVSEHPAVFERVHASLVDVLGELRSGADDAGRKVDPHR